MPKLREQLGQPPLPLPANLERCLLERYKPIPDPDPNITARVRRIIQESLTGTMHVEDYTAAGWEEARLAQKWDGPILKSFGRLVSLTLVDRSEEGGKRSNRYRVQCERNTLLQLIVLDEQHKVTMSRLEDVR